MEPIIWKKCINCKVNCCRLEISKKLFLTNKERESLIDINEKFPCKFLSKKGSCLIHKKRPVDCRLFPFDIFKKKNNFYWVYWKANCPIVKNGTKKELEECLIDFENKIIPNFKDELEDYSKFRVKDIKNIFGKPVFLRKINL